MRLLQDALKFLLVTELNDVFRYLLFLYFSGVRAPSRFSWDTKNISGSFLDYSANWSRKDQSTEKNFLKRRNPPDVGVTSGQKPSTKIIYIVLHTSVGLF